MVIMTTELAGQKQGSPEIYHGLCGKDSKNNLHK